MWRSEDRGFKISNSCVGFAYFERPKRRRPPGSCSLARASSVFRHGQQTDVALSSIGQCRFRRQFDAATPRRAGYCPCLPWPHPSVNRRTRARSWQEQVAEGERARGQRPSKGLCQDQSPRGQATESGLPHTLRRQRLAAAQPQPQAWGPQQAAPRHRFPSGDRRRTPATHPTSQPTLLRSVCIRTRLSMIGPCASLPTLDWDAPVQSMGPPLLLGARSLGTE